MIVTLSPLTALPSEESASNGTILHTHTHTHKHTHSHTHTHTHSHTHSLTHTHTHTHSLTHTHTHTHTVVPSLCTFRLSSKALLGSVTRSSSKQQVPPPLLNTPALLHLAKGPRLPHLL